MLNSVSSIRDFTAAPSVNTYVLLGKWMDAPIYYGYGICGPFY